MTLCMFVFAECFISLSLTCMCVRLSQRCHWAQKRQMQVALGSQVAHEGQAPPAWRREEDKEERREDREEERNDEQLSGFEVQ